MGTALIELETQDLVAAARRLELWAADPLSLALNRLGTTLVDCAAMAGDDPGGSAWAQAYDPARATALTAAETAVNAVHKLAAMFALSARNYAAADAASTPGVRRRDDEAVTTLVPLRTYWLPTCVPSAFGGSGGAPNGWGLIAQVVGSVWPNGHQDRLRRAASSWRSSAAALDDAAGQVIDACGLAVADGLPEAEDMWRVCVGLAGQLREVGAVHASLGSACEQLAAHIDGVHAGVIAELQSLVEWTAGIEAASGLLAIVTLGVSEAGGQAGEAARISATAANVAAIIERFTALARTAAESVATLTERADRVAGTMAGLLNVRLSTAVVEHVRTLPSALRVQELLAVRRLGALAGEFPDLVITTRQLESKFKHAEVFGVTARRGHDGFRAFDDAVRRFLASPSTRRVLGTYRGRQVILSYQLGTRFAVIQGLDGTFMSAWRLRNWQIIHVARDRSLGGG
jgi:hypothetical protein